MSESRSRTVDGVSSLDSSAEEKAHQHAPAAVSAHESKLPPASRNPVSRWYINRFGKPLYLRVKIRNQLSVAFSISKFLVAIFTLTAVGALAGISWRNNLGFIKDSATTRLSMTADLKRAQMVQAIETLEGLASSIATRSAPISLLTRWLNGTMTSNYWGFAASDTASALSAQRFYVAATLYNANLTQALLNITANPPGNRDFNDARNKKDALGVFTDENGQAQSANWDGHEGFPDELYPRASVISNTSAEKLELFNQGFIENHQSLLLGPVQVNSSYYMISFTVPVHNSTRALIGFWTILLDAQLLVDIVNTTQGMGDTGQTLLVGPNTITNIYEPRDRELTDDTEFRYLLPPVRTPELYGTVDKMGSFQAVKKAYFSVNDSDEAVAELDTRNTQGQRVSVGYGIIGSANKFADWALIVEMQNSEIYAPISKIQQLLIATVFGVVGGILLFIYPLAQWAVSPITRLRTATERTTQPPSYDDVREGRDHDDPEDGRRNSSQRGFRIPLKIPERSYFIHDELTDLTHTYNLMTEELTRHYDELEDRVFQRTREIEAQRKVAEEANESKTIFIANISHELRTPLNGILGMCSVLMGEKDPSQVQHSLRIIEKSGELLLALLTDLLTFSKNQYGNHVILEERNFRLSDVTSQLNAIFKKQATEKHIDLTVAVTPIHFLESAVFFGDSNRLMQILINLIGNSLKFTEVGSVKVKVVVKENHGKDDGLGRTNSDGSRHSKMFFSRGSLRGSSVTQKPPSRHTSLNGLQASKTDGLAEKISNVLTRTATGVPYDGNVSREDIITEKEAILPGVDSAFIGEFWVEDTGPGIPPDLHEKVFEPFTQGDRSLSRKHGGTGLGLSICRQLAALLKGTVVLKQSDNNGSQFCLTIPLKLAREGASARDSIASSLDGSLQESTVAAVLGGTNALVLEKDLGRVLPTPAGWNLTRKSRDNISIPELGLGGDLGTVINSEHKTIPITKNAGKLLDLPANPLTQMERIRVLVAEDNPVNQEVVSRMLRLESVYDIVIAKDGQEAVNRVKEALSEGKHFHIILMDVQMPTLDGIQATSVIRSLGYRAPIVALSAYSTENNIKECYDSGMDYFISKPVKKSQLRTVLKRYCSTIPEENTPSSEVESPLSMSPVQTPSIETTLLAQPPGTSGSALSLP
ncbi:Histidine kinase [Orbilia oligospora]|uniref:histidine kinase n=1 Tax=Orbilia oligospora TaxID=2813651 RepID=A0A6G1LT79_ORBOL|nr:Histidine kinase [Orbilia oligospora]KAF3232916.1 Histidine kinase [Orbilia oligospora]